MVNAYYNGRFTEIEKIRIPLTDRAIWFGDGVYDAAIGRGQKIYMLDEHIDRFFGNAKRMDIPPFCSPEMLKKILIKLLASTKEHGFLYFQLTRYSERRTHAYPDTDRSNLLITATDVTITPPDATLKLITSPDVRYKLCDVKTINLLPSVLASKQAARCGADETVFIRDGAVTECAHSNVSVIKNGVLITHPTDECILPGTARSALLRIARLLGIPVRERCFGYGELLSADEVLVTSTSKLCQRASSVDGVRYRTEGGGIGILLCRAMREELDKQLDG